MNRPVVAAKWQFERVVRTRSEFNGVDAGGWWYVNREGNGVGPFAHYAEANEVRQSEYARRDKR